MLLFKLVLIYVLAAQVGLLGVFLALAWRWV